MDLGFLHVLLVSGCVKPKRSIASSPRYFAPTMLLYFCKFFKSLEDTPGELLHGAAR